MAVRSDQSTAPPTSDLVLTREFHAPRALVWQAWTDPAHLTKWWGPHRFTTPRFELDLRPGGAIRFEMQGPDGAIYPSVGTVREVVQPERFVFTTTLERDGVNLLEVLNTVTFAEAGELTRVTLHARVLHATAAAAGPLSGMREGWSQSLDRLASYAATTAADRDLVITRRFRAPIDAVWEAWTTPAHLEAWWGPTGFTTTTARFDLQPGGEWAHTMHDPDGTDYPNVITYREIVPGRRLSYTQSGGRAGDRDVHFEATVVFERDEEDTRVTWRMRLASAADRRVVIEKYGAYEAGHQILDRLANRLQVP